jgi:prepilin peptidase dependent protein B
MRHADLTSQPAPRRQRGLSLIELMVGITIALFIAASGATLLSVHLRESRELLTEARLMQDLRTAADLISRDLRRAGYWGAAADGVWAIGATTVLTNPYLASAPSAAASDAVSFRYSRDAVENNVVDSNEQFGYRLRAGVIELQLGAGNWQALTDAGSVRISVFSVAPVLQEVDLQAFCAKPCLAIGASCPPRQQLRSWAVSISGQRVGDAGVSRSVRSQVRVRSDAVIGACAE